MSDKPAYYCGCDIHNPEEHERYKQKVVPIVTSLAVSIWRVAARWTLLMTGCGAHPHGAVNIPISQHRP